MEGKWKGGELSTRMQFGMFCSQLTFHRIIKNIIILFSFSLLNTYMPKVMPEYYIGRIIHYEN